LAIYWSIAFRRTKNSELVDETELLALASSMPVRTTMRCRLLKISYFDMKNAVEKALGADYSYSCHGDIFDISRHAENLR